MKLSVFFRKTFAGPKLLVQSTGQAVVEYLLMLVIIVGIILGVLYQFSTAFESFLDNYFGNYLECLLDSGELPAFGTQGLNAGECDAEYAGFTLSQGRPRIPDQGSATLQSSKEGRQSSLVGGQSSGSGSGSGGPVSSSGGASSGGGSGSGGPTSSSGGINSSASRNAERPSSISGRPAIQSVRSADSRNQEATSSSGDAGDGSGFGSVRTGRRIRRRVVYLENEYTTEDDKKRKAVKRNDRNKKTKLNDPGGISALRKPVMPLKVPEPRAPSSDDGKGLGLDLGFFIKFMMIGGILIGLFIFLGGQALQIKKSWQKSE